MPSIYEWQAITFRFFSNDHEPIHVHAFYAEFVSIFELHVEKGKVVEITERKMEGRSPLPERQRKLSMRLIKKYKNQIVEDRVNFHILHKKIKFKRIRGKDL